MTDDWKLICTPAADGSRHFALFSLAGGVYSEKDVSEDNPAILASMKAALEKWMDEKVETPAEGIFQ